MIYSFDCPYFRSMRKGVILCEFAKITPPDADSQKEFISTYCACTTRYKECPFYKTMDEYYRRLYSKEDDPW